MKNSLLSLVCLACATSCLAQDNGDAKPARDKQFFEKRARNNRMIGVAAAGIGALNIGLGLGAAAGDNNPLNKKTYQAQAIAGVIVGLASIPFFVAANKNKRRASELAFAPQAIPLAQPGRGPYVFQQGLSLRIPLGR